MSENSPTEIPCEIPPLLPHFEDQLLAAIKNDDDEAVEQLFRDFQFDVNSKSQTKRTYFHEAVVNHAPKVSKFLLSHHADPNLSRSIETLNEDGHTHLMGSGESPLHAMAVLIKDEEFIHFLVNSG